MSRLHKKCFLASAGMHLLLFLVLLIGPAFLMSREPANDMPTLDFIPARLVDQEIARLVQETPTSKPVPPKPPRPVVERPKQVAKKEDPPPAPQQKPVEEERGWKPTSVDLSNINRKTEKPKASSPKPQPNRAALTAASEIRNLAATPSIKIDTPSGSGQAYANYAQAIKTIYERNWHPPDETSRDDAVVRVRIVIAKDGSIVSAKIIGRSGDGGVDTSVDATLRRVREVPPFPASAKEKTRTYTIGFSLKAKRGTG
jgi:TonB family protein